MMDITAKYQETNIHSIFGGKRIEVVYLMEHSVDGRLNQYLVTCRLDGLKYRDPHLTPIDAEFLGDMALQSYDETLTAEGAMNLFEEYCL